LQKLELNKVHLKVVENGRGAETLVLLHGLLFSHRMFDAQVEYLKDRFRCVRMDFRGQGESEVTDSGYDLDTLTDDVIALIETLDAEAVHLLGFSMGGMVAQRVALKRPELLKSLVLMNTSAEAELKRKRPRFALLNLAARFIGLEYIAPKVLPLMFSDSFMEEAGHATERERWISVVTDNDRVGISRAVQGVVSRRSILDRIQAIKLPTLIITADQDRATPPIRAQNIHYRIRGSTLATIENSGHMTLVEQPGAVKRALMSFYGSP